MEVMVINPKAIKHYAQAHLQYLSPKYLLCVTSVTQVPAAQ